MIPVDGRWNRTIQQSDSSRRSNEGNPMSERKLRKRRHSVTNTDGAPKKPDRSLHSESKNHISQELIRLMYQVDLSMLCLIRKSTHEHEYPSLSLAFKDSGIDQFNNIVIHDKGNYTCIQVEHVNIHVDGNISYARLFNQQRRFSINAYFNSYVKYLISKTNDLSDVKYFILYTNSCLDLTKDKEFKERRCKNFYPFKFCSIKIEEEDILKNFLYTTYGSGGQGFYQFSHDKTTRHELFDRLEFSPFVKKMMEEIEKEAFEKFERGVKKRFLNKLIFAVDQPGREQLNVIVKGEIKKDDYATLKERILKNLLASEKHKNQMLYEFNLLMSFLHALYLDKNMLSVDFEGRGIFINYRNRITCVKACLTNASIGYRKLFLHKRDTLSINKHFTVFIEALDNDVRYFMIYTNASINLTKENYLEKGKSKNVCSIKLNRIDTGKKKYKILRSCSFINENNLYQFEEDSDLLNLLELPSWLQKEKEEGRLSDDNERELKIQFLDKLILAVDQINEIDVSDVPYSDEKLCEIALRWLESRESDLVTKQVMEKVLEDIENDRSSCEKISRKSNNEKIKFAKSIMGNDDTSEFNQFLHFLIEEKRLEVLKGHGIKLTVVSNILNGAGSDAVEAFEDLFHLWFDEEGNKRECLKILENEGINLPIVSSILNKSGANSAKAFQELYDVWFDEEGNKTSRFTSLKEKGISLVNMSSVLNGAGAAAGKSFKDLFDLWFDEGGNKKQCLHNLEKQKVNLRNVASILSGAGARASEAFQTLYDICFDDEGNKTQCLKILEKEGLNLRSVSSILSEAGANAGEALNNLYDFCFDEQGNKKQWLKTLEKEGVGLCNVTNIFSGGGPNAVGVFQSLYDLWFDRRGNKSEYLKNLEGEGINLLIVSNILHGAKANSVQSFKNLYSLWFDERGNRTSYLRILDEEGINLCEVSNVLHRAGTNAPKAFKDLFDFCFDEEGNKSSRLKNLEREGINVSNLSNILRGAGADAGKALKNLYDLWFDGEGNKSKYLKNLEEEGITLSNVSSILFSSGNNSAKAFKGLYDVWYDEEGNKTPYLITLEDEGINLSRMSSILNGAGAKASEAFKDLYNTFIDNEGNKKQHLNSFIEKKNGQKSFKLSNLSGILGEAGSNAKDAFEEFYHVCFDERGEQTKLLDDFYKAGFKPSNLSCLLNGTGSRASTILKNVHSVCFDESGKKTKVLDDFCKAGLKISHLCGLLTKAPDDLEKLHRFCFVGEGKKYLHWSLTEDKQHFTLSHLCKILQGAGKNIYSAMKSFHHVCFDEEGKNSKILNDFLKAGFSLANLSMILSKAGNNASDIFINFHKSCFNEDDYLYRLLSLEKLITPVRLSKIMKGSGTNISIIFQRLYDICFDRAGNNTKYLNELMKNYQTDDILDILSEQAKKDP